MTPEIQARGRLIRLASFGLDFRVSGQPGQREASGTRKPLTIQKAAKPHTVKLSRL